MSRISDQPYCKISPCENAIEDTRQRRDHRSLPRKGQHPWIKHRESFTADEAQKILAAEVTAQRLAYQALRESCLVHVPEIYHSFWVGKNTYIVMEFIHGISYPKYCKIHSSVEVTTLIESIAEAVRRIWNFQIPKITSPGPFGRHKPADRFFSASGAGRTFDSITELQDFISENLAGEGKKWRIDFTSETLRLCHCDLAPHNLKITSDGVIYLLDFGMAGMYPTCFEEHALANQATSDFAKRLRVLLFGQKLSPNTVAMVSAARLLW